MHKKRKFANLMKRKFANNSHTQESTAIPAEAQH